MRKQLVSGKKLLLFVDTGDNCRCPLAIGYLSKLLAQKNIDYIDLRHMGVMTPNDLLPTPEVVQLLKEEGVDIKYHRSRPVNDDLIRQADLVLGFTAIHVQTCLRRVPESKGKVFLLKQYVGLAHTGDQIHDPMGSTMEIFKKYFTDIKHSLNKLVELEFITEPPEPKEVVIAPTVSKPRRLAEADEEPVRTSRGTASASKEEKPKKEAKSKKASAGAAPEDEEPTKPSKKKAAPAAKSAKSAENKAMTKKADKAAPAKAGAKPKADKSAKAEKPAKAAKPTKVAKPAKAAKATSEKVKTVSSKAAAKELSSKKAAKPAGAKTKTPAAPKKAKAESAAAKTKTKTAGKAAAAKTATSKPAAKGKASAGKTAAKSSKSKK